MRRAVPFFPVCVELKADLSCTWREEQVFAQVKLPPKNGMISPK